ncbi:unnamed protein product, partial [Tenebrio molitor]
STDKFDAVIEAVLRIINLKTVVGFANGVDCDHDYFATFFSEENTTFAADNPVAKISTDEPLSPITAQREVESNFETNREIRQ